MKNSGLGIKEIQEAILGFKRLQLDWKTQNVTHESQSTVKSKNLTPEPERRDSGDKKINIKKREKSFTGNINTPNKVKYRVLTFRLQEM